MPPGGGPPPHIHNAEDETFVVLEGELRLEVDDRTLLATAGSVLYVPRGSRHGFSNIGTTPAKMLFLYSASGMEGMFQEIGTPAPSGSIAPAPGPDDVARLLSVATEYQFEILPPAR